MSLEITESAVSDPIMAAIILEPQSFRVETIWEHYSGCVSWGLNREKGEVQFTSGDFP